MDEATLDFLAQLTRLIDFWEGVLRQSRFLMEPSTAELIKQTVNALKELKQSYETKT